MIMFFITRGKVPYSDNTTYVIEAGNQEIDVATGISLYPGVYNVEVQYDMDTDALYSGFVYVKDDNVRARGLESVGGPLYQGKTSADCGFSYMDHTDSLRIVMRSYDLTYTVNSVRIVNTGKLWTIWAFIVTFVAALSIFSSIFIDRAKRGLIPKERVISILILGAVWFITMLPMFYQNTISTADDGYHKQRIEGTMAAIKSLQLPVRLEPHWVQGYGYANGIFYCDLFLFFPAILRLLGFSLTASYNWYISAVCFATVAVAFYSYKRIFAKERTALILSSMYALSVMKFCKLIRGGALGEGTAIIFLPLILLGLYEIFYCDKDDEYATKMSFVHLGIGSAGLVLCHILSTTITIATLLLFAIINIVRLFKKRNISLLFLSGFTALILSLWFAVPFVEYYVLEDVHVKHVYARPIQYTGLFIPQNVSMFFSNYGDRVAYENGMYHCHPQGIGFLLFVGTIVSLIICIGGIFKKTKRASRFQIHMLILSFLYFAFSLCHFPWNAIQSLGGPIKAFVSSMQFPGRFLEWGIVFSITTIGFVLTYLEENYKREIINIWIAIGIVFYMITILHLQDTSMRDASWYYIENPEGIGAGYISGAEYKPEGTNEDICFYNMTSSSDNVEISDFQAGSLTGVMHIKNTGDSEGWAEYPLLKYRGYKAYDQSGNKFEIINGVNNVIRVLIPAGYEGDIRVKFISPIYWRISEVISLLGLAFVAVYSIKAKKNIKSKGINAYGEKSGDNSCVEINEHKWQSSTLVEIILTVFTFILPAFPHITTYIFEGTYINEVLAPFLAIENKIGIRAEIFYFAALFLVFAIAIFANKYVFNKVALSVGIEKHEAGILASLCTFVYVSSPIALYTLYNRTAVLDWISILLLPISIGSLYLIIYGVITKKTKIIVIDIFILLASMIISIASYIISNPIIKDYDVLSIPVKIAKMFDMYPGKGGFNYDLYLAHPIQLSIAFFAMLIVVISILLVTKKEVTDNKEVDNITIRLLLHVIVGFLLYFVAAIPMFNVLPQQLIRIMGPQTLVALSNVILVFGIPMFKYFLDKRVKNETYKYIIYAVLITLFVLAFMYQVNDICYDSKALRFVYDNGAIE